MGIKKLVYRAIGLAVALSGPAIGMAIYRGDGVGPMLGAIGIVAGVLLFTFILARVAVAATAAVGLPRLAAILNRPWREALGGKASGSHAD